MAPALSLSISSERSGNVRGGEVVLKTPPTNLSATPDAIYQEILHKAYFKARFPSVRLTAGKTRLSWGGMECYSMLGGMCSMGAMTPL